MGRGTLMTLATLVALCACDDATVPEVLPEDHYELPEPDTSLDPARLTVGQFLATPCERYGPRAFEDLSGRDEWALVDVFFGRAADEAPMGGPSPAEIADVVDLGGRVLHEFAVPGVRARMFLSRVPELVRQGFWITVRDVPDPRRYDLEVSVVLDGPASSEDVALFESLGGRVDVVYESFPGMWGVIPDRSIPILRAQPGVTAVEYSGHVFCLW